MSDKTAAHRTLVYPDQKIAELLAENARLRAENAELRLIAYGEEINDAAE